jgi:hypothetical protein
MNETIFLSLLASAMGAFAGAGIILLIDNRRRQDDILGTANVAIASTVTLLGKLLNFKKDNAFPALADAEDLEQRVAVSDPIVVFKPQLWPETEFASGLLHSKLFEYAAKELDLIQLIKMLDYNLTELTFLIRQRNALIRRMNVLQGEGDAPPEDDLQLYIKYCQMISRNTDENLFFLDKGIEKIRRAAAALLPKRLHKGIADVGLRPETQPLMPKKDLIKGLFK